jgi:Ca2+-binding RTX toxin-like protein
LVQEEHILADYFGTVGTDNFVGGAGADNFYFNYGALQNDDVIKGGAGGNDTLAFSGTFFSSLLDVGAYGSAGVIQGIENFVFGGTAYNGYIPVSVINSADSVVWVYGSSGDDMLGSTKFNNGIIQTGIMYIIGGDGNDTLASYFGSNDALVGGAGNDTISGSHAYMDGGDGNDTFLIDGTCTVVAGAGDDVINATVGGYIDGGSGVDTLKVSGAFDATHVTNVEKLDLSTYQQNAVVTMNLSQLAAFSVIGNFSASVADRFILLGNGGYDFGAAAYTNAVDVTVQQQTTGVTLTGTQFNDVFHGSGFADYIAGGAGNDTIYGGVGADYLAGGDGNDTIYGDTGSDIMLGGAGNDTIVTATYTYALPQLGGTSYVDGGDGNDYLIANGLNDYLVGGAGDDVLLSQSIEATYLLGGSGNDYIVGDDGNDYIDGGTGSDLLKGGFGSDYFVGGAGNDYFVMNLDDYYASYDFITDFTVGQDYIALPTYMLGKAQFLDTAYGVDIYYQDAGGWYQIYVTNTHNVTDVKNGVYYSDL